MAFEAPQFTWLVEPGEKVRMGQPIGYVRYSQEAEDITEVLYPEALQQGLDKVKRVMDETPVVQGEETVAEETPAEVVEETAVEIAVEATDESMEELVEVVDETPVVEEVVSEMEQLEVEITPALQTVIVEAVKEECVHEEEEEWVVFAETKEEEEEDVWCFVCFRKSVEVINTLRWPRRIIRKIRKSLWRR